MTRREALEQEYRRDLETSNVGRFLLALLCACEVHKINRPRAELDASDLLAERILNFAGFTTDCWIINEVAAEQASYDIEREA